MAWTTGDVSFFENTVVTADETIGTGDGVQTVFNYTVLNPPVFLDSFTIKYTVASTVYTATSDSAGVITGTHISSGSVTEAGVIDLTFSTAPDNTTLIYVDEYKAKGLLQVLLDYVSATQYTETLGTGDGSQTVFSTTLSNTPIADGQVRLRFQIGATVYDVWENGSGAFEHLLISTSSVNKATGAVSVTFTQAIDNLYQMDILYGVGSAGQDWLTLLKQPSEDSGQSSAFPSDELNEVILKNSGLSFKEFIAVGIREFKYQTATQFGWNLNLYREWDAAQDVSQNWNFNGVESLSSGYDSTRELWNALPTQMFSETSIKYWFFSNKRRIIVIARSLGTIYTSSYLGGAKRLSSPSRYLYPNVVIGSSYGATVSVSTEGVAHKFIANSQAIGNAALLLLPTTDSYEKLDDVGIVPSHTFINTGTLKRTTNNLVLLYPLYYYHSDITPRKILFELDEVYLCPFDDLANEDILEIGADDYLVTQNVYRSTYQDFMAVKME